MLTLTDLAAHQLQFLLEQKDLPDHGLRVFVQGGGCAGMQYGMSYEDTTREGDTVLEDKGVRLYVDAFSVQFLDGACIDYTRTVTGAGFRVENPNAVGTCACGASFRTVGHQDDEPGRIGTEGAVYGLRAAG
jgi:iron-sulfur cluster assembly accessory protein